MNRTAFQLLAAAALGMTAIASAQEAEKPVTVNLERVPPHLRARIEAKAQEGHTALRRYLEFTRHMHDVRIEHLVRPQDAPAIAKAGKEDGKLADIGEKARK